MLLQTFGSYGANFHPHLHAIVTEGVFTPDGRFHPVIWPEPDVLEEAFRRRFLEKLEAAGRLRPETRERFLSWAHSGFSVEATQRLAAGERERAERLARYATRVVLGAGAVRWAGKGRVALETPPDLRTGATSLDLDELEFVHAVCRHVPARRMHLVRYYGVYANRLRRRHRAARWALAGEEQPADEGAEDAAPFEEQVPPAPPGSAEALRRQAWARLIRKVFEVDPLLCPRCQVEMEIVAWITDPKVIDRILKHRRERGMRSVFETPPARGLAERECPLVDTRSLAAAARRLAKAGRLSARGLAPTHGFRRRCRRRRGGGAASRARRGSRCAGPERPGWVVGDLGAGRQGQGRTRAARRSARAGCLRVPRGRFNALCLAR